MNLRGASTRQIIGRHALVLFASRGVDAVSVRDIGAAAGLSNPALFRHFASKEALAADLFASRYARLVAAVRAAPAEGGLVAWLGAALAEIAAEPEAVLYVLDNLRRFFATLPADLRAANLPALIGAMVAREQAAGRFRRDLDSGLAVTLIAGVLGQVARSVHFHDTVLDVPAHATRFADLLAHGLAAPETAR